MEELARDFGNANFCDRENFRFRIFDRFGSMQGFHVRGKTKYQTKVGSIFSFIWLFLISLAFVFYLRKLMDKTEPIMQMNQYRDKEAVTIDLKKEKYQLYWTIISMKDGKRLTWDEFWSSFSAYASIISFPTSGIYSWRNIPMVPCDTQKWWMEQNSEELKSRKNIYFCLDAEEISLSNGNVQPFHKLSVDFYTCQPGGIIPCDIKLQSSDIMLQTRAYEKTLNIKDFNNPIYDNHRELSVVYPDDKIRIEQKYWIGWTELITDKGFLRADWEKKKIVTIFNKESTFGSKSLARIRNNYLSQGRLFYADMDLHIEIHTTNEKVEIYRNYVSVIDIISAVGG